MKKRILILISGFVLFVGSSVLAGDGDLIVEGNIGVGTSAPQTALDIRGGAVFNEDGGNYNFRIETSLNPNIFYVDGTISKIAIGHNSPTAFLDIRQGNGTLAGITAYDTLGVAVTNGNSFSRAAKMSAERSNTSPLSMAMFGSEISAVFTGSANLTSDQALVGAFYRVVLRTPSPNISITGAKGVTSTLFVHEDTTNNPVLTTFTAYDSQGINVESSSVNVLNYRHFYAANVPYMGTMQSRNLYGMVIEKQTGGVSNYGIVLNGDGSGADIAFGNNKETKLYGSQGNFIINTSGNIAIGSSAPREARSGRCSQDIRYILSM